MDVSTDRNDLQQDRCKKNLEFQNPTAVSSIETNRYVLSSIEIREPRFPEFQSFVITNFNIIVSTIRDWLGRIWMRPRD